MCKRKKGLSVLNLAALLTLGAVATMALDLYDPGDTELLKEFGQCSEELRGCYCDEGCQKYGDCCFDSPLFNKTQQRDSRGAFKCVKLNGHSGQGLYMIANCPHDWDDKRIKDKCEEEDGNVEDPLITEPVVSQDSSALYRNAYCAQCNNISTFGFLGIQVTCGKANNQQHSIKYQRRNKRTTNVNSTASADRLSNCSFRSLYDTRQYNKFGKNVDSAKYSKFRLCVPHAIETCRDGWADENVRQKCQVYTSYKSQSLPFLVYRNPFCKICNPVPKHMVSLYDLQKLALYYLFVRMKVFHDPWILVPKTQLLPDKGTNEYIKFLLAVDYKVESNNSYAKLSQTFKKHFTFDAPNLLAKLIKRLRDYEIAMLVINEFWERVCVILLSISILLLSIHLLVFALIPRKNRTLLDYNLASFCFALLMTYIPNLSLYALMKYGNDNLNNFLLVLLLYSFFATLMWMLTMSFDVWRSMRAASKCLHLDTHEESRRRFTIYAWWSWSMAGLAEFVIILISSFGKIDEFCVILHSKLASRVDILPSIANLESIVLCSFVVTILDSFFLSHTIYLIYNSRTKPVETHTKLELLQNSRNADGTLHHHSAASHLVRVEEIRRQIRTFAILALQTGLTWIVGFLIYIDGDVIHTLTFLILSSCHSFLIFFFFMCKKEKLEAIAKEIHFLKGNFIRRHSV